ncbi:MAG: cyclohexa-1,5-dienecarbonyl-CoA hydratase [Deltaproteobacteria bacterium]|jgi:cyclohexa-1,5-dienecarbonyl-CoA hydratase|nr:cyclohexa-1,5-dienecarbonyl-CoA hydratase [Deltaproteobacteria bacterium]MBT4644204.1 cyclohexa-1,5-dienecarbonyl-CoA hydratase [Deltaproteobacteria bacterium]MBT6500468.1 cyclohexa-1,5-dienecarbonyl-CoA hydratase [Deltaproteobacteria bacterium]MBT6612388.1 cyclohexa-1,5-dienecarbonyl-CoA hydratase [Deltaproteobacteria bacterium]MBT7154725.1 cyclohexa-1,5-dienecarbonyl-CoA hydratase [Deltaproteobacteria bacterium]
MKCTSWKTLDEGKILLARLNQPKANVLDAAMIGELNQGLQEKVNKGIRAVVLSHEGPHFSFGASVPEHTAENAPAMLDSFHGLFKAIHQLSVPVLAAVGGQCLGGGFELASFCHLLFCSPQSKFGQPEILLGVFPPMASLILNIKAPGLADEINLTGRTFSAQEFQSAGLINCIDENPEQAALDFAAKHFVPKSAISVRHAVRANRWRFDKALNDELPRLEAQYLDELMKTRDANEGIGAFMEKRTPEWTDD